MQDGGLRQVYSSGTYVGLAIFRSCSGVEGSYTCLPTNIIKQVYFQQSIVHPFPELVGVSQTSLEIHISP